MKPSEIALDSNCTKRYVNDIIRKHTIGNSIKQLLDIVLKSGKKIDDFSESELNALDILDAFAEKNIVK